LNHSDIQIKNCLADCFGFLDVLQSSGVGGLSGIGSYIFLTEHWGQINKSIQHIYNNFEDVIPLLESIESVFFESPDRLSLYREVSNKHVHSHPIYDEAGKQLTEYFERLNIDQVIDSPVNIYHSIKESNDFDLNRILFAFFLDHICGHDATECITNKIVRIQKNTSESGESRTIFTEPYNFDKDRFRLPEVFLKLLNLTELHLKITKYNYALELERLDSLLQDNLELLTFHLNHQYRKLYTYKIYDNIYDIYYPGSLVESLLKSIELLAKSNLYSNENQFSNLQELYGLLLKFNSDLTLDFHKNELHNFQCILFERAKNAFRFGLISDKKYLSYEEKLRGIEKKQITNARERLEKINYLNSAEIIPAIRTSIWSHKNRAFYEEEIKPSLEAEEFLEIDFNSGIYFDYLREYFKETAFGAYKTCDRNILLEKGLHLSRLYKMYESEFTNINLIKGMLLDAKAFDEFEELTKWSIIDTSYPTTALEEIISIHHKFDKTLTFSGELLLSQVYWERQKKLVQLFNDEIITYLNKYIESKNLQYLPLQLLEKYTDANYIDLNFDNLRNQWIEENYTTNGKFPFQKVEVINDLKSFKTVNETYNPFNDIYRTRFDLIAEYDEKIDFDFIEVPKLELPYSIAEFMQLEFLSIFRNAIDEFTKENDLKIGDDRWVSEKYLFYKIKELLPNVPVIRHARPQWLGRQHFDIYIPSRNLAIEYNGRQHYEAIDYFGGIEGLEHRKVLDRKKLQKAERNNTVVIIHRYDDNYDSTINLLIEHLKLYS